MDATPALIAYLDLDFRYLGVNKAYETGSYALIKASLESLDGEIVGERAWEIVQPFLERAKVWRADQL